MKRMFQKTLAVAVAGVSMAVSMGGIHASAATVVKSGKEAVSPTGTIEGKILLDWYFPAGGVNVYTVTAETDVLNVSGCYTIYTGLDLVNYPTGTLRQSSSKNGTIASVSGTHSGNNQARAYASFEVRGSSNSVLYLESNVLNV